MSMEKNEVNSLEQRATLFVSVDTRAQTAVLAVPDETSFSD